MGSGGNPASRPCISLAGGEMVADERPDGFRHAIGFSDPLLVVNLG
jgi:hypothetical protein